MPSKKVKVKKEYPLCPRCKTPSVAGAHMTSNGWRSLYCVNDNCNYDVRFEELTTPIVGYKNTTGDSPKVEASEKGYAIVGGNFTGTVIGVDGRFAVYYTKKESETIVKSAPFIGYKIIPCVITYKI